MDRTIAREALERIIAGGSTEEQIEKLSEIGEYISSWSGDSEEN